jgi:hypothetical protein
MFFFAPMSEASSPRNAGVDDASQTRADRHEAGVRSSGMRFLCRADLWRAALFLFSAD